jgi:hypothetical protein
VASRVDSQDTAVCLDLGERTRHEEPHAGCAGGCVARRAVCNPDKRRSPESPGKREGD